MKIFIFTVFFICFSTIVCSEELQTIGNEIEEEYYKLFLRKSAILLDKNEISIDFTLSYLNNLEQIFLSDYIVNRSLSLETAFQVGLHERFEAFIVLPLVWSKEVFRSEATYDKNTNFSIGDVNIGTKILLLHESEINPDLVYSIGVGFPTGKNPYTNNIGTGSGNWVISMGFNAIKSCDPSIIFAGIAGTYALANSFESIKYQPGWTIGYNIGLGLAFNDKVTLSFKSIGSYQYRSSVDNKDLINSVREPASIQLGFTYNITNKLIFEYSQTIGLNEDANDTYSEFTISKKF